jgi:hypothetical protein
MVPDHLFESHQDEHFAERLAAEDFERQQNDQIADAELARALANNESDVGNLGGEGDDFQLALALNREFRNEEEERFFRQVQVYPFMNKVSLISETGNRCGRSGRRGTSKQECKDR